MLDGNIVVNHEGFSTSRSQEIFITPFSRISKGSSNNFCPSLDGILGCKSAISIFGSLSSNDPHNAFRVLLLISVRREGFSFDAWEATTAAADAITVSTANQ